MAFHHLAFATRDLPATHAFYSEAMGFPLERVSVGPCPEGGWARHVFYDTGNGEQIAFWDIYDNPRVGDFDPSISRGLGLPDWTNHVAFEAKSLDDIAVARDRWLGEGHDVVEIDHGWCTSIYTMDPNGIMVEWCCTTAVTTDQDRADAAAWLFMEQPPFHENPDVQFHMAADFAPVG
jgi:catechol 2,3-dioxygenase-like lactoylglutathione lyase family enzyme